MKSRLLHLLPPFFALVVFVAGSFAQAPMTSTSSKLTTATCGKPVCTWNAFGPSSYTRQTGGPQTISSSFSVLNAKIQFTLHIDNNGVSSAVISVNGQQIFGPDDFSANVTSVDRAVTLSTNNIVQVELRGKPGESLAVTVIGVDNDPPSITETEVPVPNSFGWNNTNVNVSFTCSDATSGIASCSGPFLLTTQGLNQVVTGTAFDLAGNSATASIQISIDKTPPTIVSSQTPPANSFGWNNTSVTVNFLCNDNLSGVQFCAPAILLSNQGQNQAATGNATDFAGNSATTSTSVSIDLTPPTIVATISPAPNAKGWNNTPVTVSFSCADDLSGVASCPSNQTVSSQDANQTISGTATDKAGNRASTSATVNLDETPPVINITSPSDNSVVNASALVVTGTASDALSGVAAVTCNGVVAVFQAGSFSCSLVLKQGANTIDIQATDVAGNSAAVTRTVDFVSTEPLAFLSAPPGAAVVGKSLQYQVKAESPNPDTLSFFLLQAPAGMNIDSGAGLLTWTPSANQIGDQSVIIIARDSTGQIFQSFTISVIGSRVVASAHILAAGGGVITVNDPGSKINGLSINIPSGALPSDTTIAISELSGSSSLAGTRRFLLKGFAIDPEGISLTVPATVVVPYSANEFDGSEGIPLEDFLGAYFLDTATGNLQGLSTFAVDTTNHVVAGTIPHFSAWEITNLARLCPPPNAQSDCPNAYSPATPSNQLPAIMVHGFVFSLETGFGDESTWGGIGGLRSMLEHLDKGGHDRVDAWRFDYDSANMWFEISAGNLATAITFVKQKAGTSLVNLVAHSFGGILVRTYLEDQANFGDSHYAAKFYSNRNDVNRVMTLGTPHSGIGGDFSTFYANLCAATAVEAQIQSAGQSTFLITCLETIPGFGDGLLINRLNDLPLPVLQSGAAPQYDIVRGQLLLQDPTTSPTLIPNDGLITSQGAAIPCSAGCPSDLVVETIAKTNADQFGLCHSPVLFNAPFGCGSSDEDIPLNVAMAAVNSAKHPMWQKLCLFLDSNADTCSPTLTVILSDPNGGRVVTSFQQPPIDCGQNCIASYPAGTFVSLTPIPNAAAFFFSGWSGDCRGGGTATVLMDSDKTCTAIFSLRPIQISSTTCALTVFPDGVVENVSVQGSVTDSVFGDSLALNLAGPISCGPWSQPGGTCVHNLGQPNSTSWSYGPAEFTFPEVTSVTAFLIQPSGAIISTTSVPLNCK